MNENIIQTILLSTTIKDNSFQSLKLSPNDWIIPSTNTISCIYFYNIQQWSFYEKQCHNLFMNIERLISSLKKLLEYYPLFNGTLKMFDTDKKVCVEENNLQGGILFVATIVNISLNDLSLLSNEEYVNNEIIPDTLQLMNVVDSETLFHIRHTRFACGSVALGISLNHQIADAHSYFQLIQHWVELYQNLDASINVSHQRSLLELTIEEINHLKIVNPDFNNRKSLSVNHDDEKNSSSTQLTKQIMLKTFRFTADELRRMKTDCLNHLSSDIDYVSTFEVLTAHLYRQVMLARYPLSSSSLITKLYISTNIRSRLIQPPLPHIYFGNAIMFSYLEMNLSDLIHTHHLSHIASLVHKSIKSNTNNDIRTTLAWIQCQSDKTKIQPTFNLNETDFTISAWNKMNMYTDSDFERDVYPCKILLPPSTKFNGAAILFSTEKNDATIDVILGLDIDEMNRLEMNSDFRKYRH